jgi:hypothetical protein
MESQYSFKFLGIFTLRVMFGDFVWGHDAYYGLEDYKQIFRGRISTLGYSSEPRRSAILNFDHNFNCMKEKAII